MLKKYINKKFNEDLKDIVIKDEKKFKRILVLNNYYNVAICMFK